MLDGNGEQIKWTRACAIASYFSVSFRRRSSRRSNVGARTVTVSVEVASPERNVSVAVPGVDPAYTVDPEATAVFGLVVSHL